MRGRTIVRTRCREGKRKEGLLGLKQTGRAGCQAEKANSFALECKGGVKEEGNVSAPGSVGWIGVRKNLLPRQSLEKKEEEERREDTPS